VIDGKCRIKRQADLGMADLLASTDLCKNTAARPMPDDRRSFVPVGY
jgi:hypothetical protein